MVLKAMTALKRHFLIAQFCYLFRTYPLRKTWRHKLVTFAEAGNLLLRYFWLRFMLRFGSAPSRADGRSCVVVLLSHNRPQNIPILIKGALRSGFVSKIVMSNSNPKVSLEDWINLEDSRLLLNESEPTQPGHRLFLAKETGAEYVLAIDDDIFFTRDNGKCFLGSSSLTSNVRTKLSDRFIARAPPLRMAAGFTTWLDEKPRWTC